MNLKAIFTDIKNFFIKEKPIVDEFFAKANNFVNVVKAVVNSADGQLVLTILEGFFPAAIVAKVGADIVKYLTDFNLATAEEGKPIGDIILDGFKAILGLSLPSKTLALINLAAVAGHSASVNSGGDSTLQQAVISLPILHDPSVIGVAPAAAVVQLNAPPVGDDVANKAATSDDAAQEEAPLDPK